MRCILCGAPLGLRGSAPARRISKEPAHYAHMDCLRSALLTRYYQGLYQGKESDDDHTPTIQ